MVKLGTEGPSPLVVARALAAQGLQVFPAKYKDKYPIVDWKKFIDVPATPMLDKWFKGSTLTNYWVMTGRQSGYCVVDADSEEGDLWWRDQLGDELFNATATSESRKGPHYWFRIPEDWAGEIPSWSVHPGEKDDHQISFDFRADKAGVIVPPSIHETGFQYKWGEVPLSQAQIAPRAMLDGTIRENRPSTTGETTGTVAGAGGQPRTLLSRLLEQPPGGEGSGRNDWLARVAGHYAKHDHNAQDLYETHCRMANQLMGQPLEDKEFRKTVESIWRSEHKRNQYRTIDASCGYLASGGTNINVQVRTKDEYRFVEYADFDLRAKGVMTNEDNQRTYLAEVVRASRADPSVTEKFDILLRAEVFGDDRTIRRALSKYACTIVPPTGMFPKEGGPGARIQRYLESQQPPVVEITPALGFHPTAIDAGNGGYVTHEGVITATGLVDVASSAVRADPRLKTGGTAPHSYGFVDDAKTARDVLADMMTFHDEIVCTVFGSWWAACLLKPQIQERTSLFPFMAVEAPSESGKTNGFFALMMQANGDTRGETQPTRAALRDMAAAHRNGITWIDDLDDPAYLMELLRAATSGGSLTKMGEDRESVKNTPIVSPIVISGEALGLGTQKALIDRAITLKASNPTSRRSFKDPEKPQWDDILELRAAYPEGLHVLAGWYVQDALSVVDKTLEAVRAGRAGGSGRASDKVAVLRAGARLMDHMLRLEGAWTIRGPNARRLEKWLANNLVDSEGAPITSNENTLTLEVLPWALRKWKFPTKPLAGERGDMDTPVYIKNYEPEDSLFGSGMVLGFSADLLAEAWEDHKRGRQEKRTTTAESFREQAKALGWHSTQQKIVNGGGRRASYFRSSDDVARSTIRRAIGG